MQNSNKKHPTHNKNISQPSYDSQHIPPHQSSKIASFSQIPKVDTLLSHPLLASFSKATILPLIRTELQILRTKIKHNNISEQNLQTYLANLIQTLIEKATKIEKKSLQQVINATGVVLHTNLGRSVFSHELLNEITPYLCHYHTLEYDIAQGKRSERYMHIRQILCEMLECEDALIVNNNAAAVFLILNTFAPQKEVIISRGELVEIGGSFRIPEIMKSASGLLREVGTSNKTHLYDYKNAINDYSAMIMKVHQSNFAQLGFVSHCSMRELTQLARAHKLIDYYDLGSGYLGFDNLNLYEPNLYEIMRAKPSLVSFSGDKLLGGPQAGIIVGRAELITRLKQNQLLRALRVDKFTLLALQATLQAHKDKAYSKIPSLHMLSLNTQELYNRAQSLLQAISKAQLLNTDSKLHAEIVPLRSLAGGGSLPHAHFESYGLALSAHDRDVQSFETQLRHLGLITCVQKDKILLDTRTLLEGDEECIVEILCKIFTKNGNDI